MPAAPSRGEHSLELVEQYVKGGAWAARVELAKGVLEAASPHEHDSAMVASQRTSAFTSAFATHLRAAAAAEASQAASSHEHRSAVPTSQRTSAFRHWAHEHDSETFRVHGFVRNPFAGSNHLRSQIKTRHDELTALRCGILPEELRNAKPFPGQRAGHIRDRDGLLGAMLPTPPPLRLPDTVQRVVALYKAGHIRDPADLPTPSDVDGRDFGLAHLTCFVEMKQRGHVGHMRASHEHPPERVHPDYAGNPALTHHHSKWFRGNTWARYPPPSVSNSKLGSRRSAAKFTHWCCDAAIAAPPSRAFVPLTTASHRFVGSFPQCLAQLDRADPQHPCRSSCLPPRPYLDRATLEPFDPDRLSGACYGKMQKLLEAVQPEAGAFDALRLTNLAYAVTLQGRREWLARITKCLSNVSGLGGKCVAPRAARAIMTIFGPIDPSEWRNQTWGDVLGIMVDAGDHLTDLFPLDTPASAIAVQLPFPLDHLPMFICIVPGNLQADIFNLRADARADIVNLSNSLSPHRQ